MLQNGWALESDFLQNDPGNRACMGLKASHFIGEISTGICKWVILGPFPNDRFVALGFTTSYMMSYNPTKLFGFINPLSRHVFSCFPFILMGINYINHHKPNQQRLKNLRPSLCAVLRKDLFAILVGAVNGQPRPRCELCQRRGRGHLTQRLGVNKNKYGERCEKYGPIQMIVTGECDYLC